MPTNGITWYANNSMWWPNSYTYLQVPATYSTTCVNTAGTVNITNTVSVTYSYVPWVPSKAYIRKQAEELRLKRLAERRSKALLRDILGDRRYRQFVKDGSVWVESRIHDDTAMEIRPGRMIQLHKKVGGVWRLTRGQLCIHPGEQFPSGDEVASIYLSAKYDEKDLWATANVHGNPAELIAA